MPLTAKGQKILAAMQEEYGEEEGKRIFYASKNAGTISGVDKQSDLFDARRRTTIRSPSGRVIETREEEEEEDAVRDAWGTMNDSLALELDDAAEAVVIDGGYMRAMPRIARTGIQLYRGKECGREDMAKVRVYRPSDQVFAPDAVKSYTHLPVTIEHPGTAIDASNWKRHAVGETGEEVLRDGGTVRVPMMLRDAAAIRAVRDGKNQISVGYSCDLEWVDGITSDGDKYDAVQRNIRGNHVAIVSTARGGPELKFGDHEGDHAMDIKTVTVDGIPCQMTDVAASVVLRMQDQLENLKKKNSEEEEEKKKKKDAAAKDLEAKDAAIKVKDAEIADLQAKLKDALSPERLDKAVKDRSAVIDKAQKIAGGRLKTDGMSDGDIRREVVNGKLGDVAKGWDDSKIEAAFDAITVTASPIADAARVFAGRPGNGYAADARAEVDRAYYDSVKELENAWRGPQK